MTLRDAAPVLARLIDSAVIIGAGRGQEVDACLGYGARRILAIEPDPEVLALLAGRLAGRLVGGAEVSLVAGAVIDRAQTPRAWFHRWSLPGLNSLRGAIAPERFWPGIQRRDPVEVDRIEVVPLLRGFAADPALPNLLVVQAGGDGLSLLAALAEAELIGAFAHVTVRAAGQPLWEGGDTIMRIGDFLGDLGYQALTPGPMPGDDPLLGRHRFSRPPGAALRQSAAEAALCRVQTELAQARRDLLAARAGTGAPD